MDFKETLRKLQEDVLTPDQIKANQAKDVAKANFVKNGKLKPGEDIELDPTDPTKTKYRVISAQAIQQASRSTLTR